MFLVSTKNSINLNANLDTWSGNMASGNKNHASSWFVFSAAALRCSQTKAKRSLALRIAPGVPVAENSVTVNEGWIYGWDGTLHGLHHHYMQLCSRGRARGHAWGSV